MFSKYNTFYWKREKEEKCEKSERNLSNHLKFLIKKHLELAIFIY